MAQWLVTQGDNQFPVDGIAELKQLAQSGSLRLGDLIQPPGANDWVYAAEVPDLASLLPDDDDDDDDLGYSRGMAAAAVTGIMVMGLGFVSLLGVGAILFFVQQLPSGDEAIVGEGGLSYTQMIVTQPDSGLRARPDTKDVIAVPLAKDDVLELLTKRGSFYKAKTTTGGEGWIPVAHVIPMYQLGGAKVRDEYDPLYNPDRYVEVTNARWMQLPTDKPGDEEESHITIFELQFSNDAQYDMTGLVVQVTVKDVKGQELETVELPIEGIIPTDGRTMVGTLVPEDAEKLEKKGEPVPKRRVTTYSYEQELENAPELEALYTSGVEVELSGEEFTNAEIDVIELRAIPKDEEEQG